MRRWRGPAPWAGLSARLFVAQALVVSAGTLTMTVTAILLAPGLFRLHVTRALGTVPEGLAIHLDRALSTALLDALGVAITVALGTALAVTWLMGRRVGRPIAATAAAARRIADGEYHIRVPPSQLGAEFAVLDNAFNRMAATLENTECHRRAMLADLAHELRTPVATLDSFLEGIQDGVIPADEATWQTMREQTGRLRRLVEDLGELSYAEERRLAEPLPLVELGALVDEALRAASAGFDAKGVALRRQPGQASGQVLGDPDRLREILDNLLGNALRHTPLGGQVSLTVADEADTVVVRVEDTGEGIRAEHLPHLFDRFYRADPARTRSGEGSGIGLTIARALAQAHGGTLRAASAGSGRGATFTLTLPAARQRERATTSTAIRPE